MSALHSLYRPIVLKYWEKIHSSRYLYFVQGISRDPLKLQFLKSLQQIAQRCETELVAEGVEDIEDFLVLRELGISYAQGYLIERPSKAPNTVGSPASAGFLLGGQFAAHQRA